MFGSLKTSSFAGSLGFALVAFFLLLKLVKMISEVREAFHYPAVPEA